MEGGSKLSYDRSSVEFQPVNVTRDGVVITTNITTSITAPNTRPTVWIPTVTLSGKVGFMISGLSSGLYQVWVQINSGAETPVLNAGTIQIV